METQLVAQACASNASAVAMPCSGVALTVGMAYPILAGNLIKFFHLGDTPMAKQVEAQAKVAVW
jgi:hypothetical protein